MFTPVARARSQIFLVPFHHLTLQCGARFSIGAMEITLQYFNGCPNWMVAAERLALIAQDRTDLTVTHLQVETPEDAEATGFRGSPSILLNGADLFPDPATSVGLSCRLYLTPNGVAGAPTLEQLRAAITAT